MRSDRNIENDQIKKPEGHTCKKMQKEDLLLYAVTDRHWLNGETLYSQVEKTLEGGTTFVQLREKELDEAHFLEEAKKIKELCDRYHVPFVINDNVDIALEIDADGVHVGQSDMEAGDVRANLDRTRSLVYLHKRSDRHCSHRKEGQITLGSEQSFIQIRKQMQLI